VQQYIIYNGNFFSANEGIITPSNRAFLYGDGLFESMFASGGVIPFLDYHVQRLNHGMEKLEMQDGQKKINSENIAYQTGRLLRKNRNFKGVRVRLVVFRNEGGLYTPETNAVSYLITAEELPNQYFILNKKGFMVDIYTNGRKNSGPLAGLKSTNALLYVMAGNFRKKRNLDECLLLNQNHYLCEGQSSNIFIIKKDVLYTPPLQDGCVQGVMRSIVIDLAKKIRLKVADKISLDANLLQEADEVFLTNAVNGIRWVVAYRNKRYYHKIAVNLMQKLNEIAFPDVYI